ncbi:MAG TPA: ABC transporter ATP-binding protein [Anaerolineae bacterium]|nr:ABC transporter ATP-binding protein [Caldilineae bacterium]HID34055.1 ABC transporter ATP-binding protein [Anaerolineae bacterium]
MLVVNKLSVSYDEAPALRDISLQVEEGELVSIIGANGAGKSTLLKAIAGLLQPDEGSIQFHGEALVGRPPYEIVRLGLALTPEGRRLFSRMSVYENLLVGATPNKDPAVRQALLEEIFTLFPRLQERQKQKAGTLSGGEQQMLAIGRSLMSQPRLLMLDEPSLGLMPLLVDHILETLQRLNQERGMTILLVEQNVREALEIAHRGYVLQSGRIVAEDEAQALLRSDLVRRAYLGI